MRGENHTSRFGRFVLTKDAQDDAPLARKKPESRILPLYKNSKWYYGKHMAQLWVHSDGTIMPGTK